MTGSQEIEDRHQQWGGTTIDSCQNVPCKGSRYNIDNISRNSGTGMYRTTNMHAYNL